jgi:DNA-binding transcriptional MerR regulator
MDKTTVEEKEFYTMEEVLSIAKDIALDIDERTFKYYLSLEIISKPVKNPYPEGDKRIKFYPAIVLDQLKRIFQLKNRGFSLKQIKKLLLEEESQELDVLIDVTDKDEKREISHAFLESVCGDESRRAWREFLATSLSDVSEKNLFDSVRNYLALMLKSWLKSDEAEKYVDEFLINLSPDDRDRVLIPFRKGRDEEISKHRGDRLDLLKYLQKLCGRVILGRYNRKEVEDWIERLIANLEKMKKSYETLKAEDSLEDEMKSFMKKGIELYLESLSEIRENLSSKKRDVLIAALGKARSASDIMNGMEEIIEKKMLLINLIS